MGFSITKAGCVHGRKTPRKACPRPHVEWFGAMLSSLRFALACAIALALPFSAPTGTAEGQTVESEDASIAEDVFLRPNRDLVQSLNNSKRLLKQRRFSEAVRILGQITDCEDDFFVRPDGGGNEFRSLKSEVCRLIAEMPGECRELYELEYGAKAEHRLRGAAAAQDVEAIAEVSRKYFYTRAGGDATLLLGLSYLDRDRPLAAARILSRLRESWDGGARHEPTLSTAMAVCWARAGFEGKANECLESLRLRYPNSEINIGGRPVRLFADGEDPLERLQSRTGELYVEADDRSYGDAAGGIPLLNMLWCVPASQHPSAEHIFHSKLQYCRERDIAPITAGRPLAVGDVVLTRTASTLVAVDFRTGKRIWAVPFDDLLDDENAAERDSHRKPGYRADALCGRYQQDGIYSSLSSDGRLVYSIEDLGSGFVLREPEFIVVGGRRVKNPSWARSYNQLAAHDIRTGKLVWQIGGPPDPAAGDTETAAGDASLDGGILPAAGSFFLGAPLCHSGRLYLLDEFDGEIRLVVIEAESGEVLWTKPLAVVENAISQDAFRRYTAVSPVYADGILICPTGNGAVAAVEEATRSLLWGYAFSYDTKGKSMNRVFRQRQLAAMRMPGMGNPAGSSWLGIEAAIVDDRVVLAAPETDHLYCLGLFDGKLHWKSLRKGDLFIACADRERVVLAAARSVRALNVSDGKPAWDKREVALGDNASVSGQGFFANGYYYLPMGAGGVSAINVENGKIELVSKSRERNMPGNLVLHEGKILSQGLDGLKSYYELGSLRKRVNDALAKTPDNPIALSLKGEILIDEGKRDEAIGALRLAYRQNHGARAEWLLRESLLEGLAEDFDKYRPAADELAQLCDGNDMYHARYLQVLGEGLEKSGDWDAALESYLRLADLPYGDKLMISPSDSHQVRLDRWLRVRFASLGKNASGAAMRRLGEESQARLRVAAASADLTDFRRFLDQFAHNSAAVEGRSRFVERLVAEGGLAEAEMLLRQEARSSDRRVGGRAVIRLAELLRKAGRLEDAADCYRRLAFEFAEAECSDGLTGRQVVERLPKDDAVRRWFRPDKSWPIGAVDVDQTSLKKRPRTRRYLTDLNFQGSRRPSFAHRQLKFEQRTMMLNSIDAYGNLLWQHSLSEDAAPRNLHINQNEANVAARGHLIVLAVGGQYMAIDCVDPRSTEVIWRHQPEQAINEVQNPGQMAANAFMVQARQLDAAFGRSGKSSWQTALLTDQYMCYRKFRGVVALDPVSGRKIWENGDLPQNCTLFGDENLLFAVPLDSTEATVLRGVDGQKLTTVSLPPQGERLAAIGRFILVWRLKNGRRVVEMLDPWKNEAVWGPHSFSPDAKCHVVGNESLGVMEPGGRFTLISLGDGKKKIETQLKAEPNLNEIVVLEADGEHFLVTDARQRHRSGGTLRAINGVASQLIRKGRVYGFGRDGRPLWADFPQGVEIENQHLLLQQPGRLPVLTFAETAYDPNNRSSRWHTLVMMIDKRNGRVLLDQKFDQQTSEFELSGNPATNTVNLHMQTDNLQLVFTGKPLPPVEKKLPVNMKPRGTLGGVFKAFEKVTKQQIHGFPGR